MGKHHQEELCEWEDRTFIYSRDSPLNFNATELIQNLLNVGRGPSSKTWPKCAPHDEQVTSVLIIPYELSGCSSIESLDTGA